MRSVLLGLVVLAMTVPPGGALVGNLWGHATGAEPLLRPDTAWVEEPWGYRHASLQSPNGDWPTVFTMEGYAGASRPAPNAYLRMDDGVLLALRIGFGHGPRGDYAQVQASIRGTECSGGAFDLYDRRHAWDGHHVVQWVAGQPWSNGNVGMYGNSYPGQTAYWVATTQPPALKAVMPSLLHSDIYRDIFMPGGVQNILFPSVWTYGLGVVGGPHRVPSDSVQKGTIPGDEICTQHQARRWSAGDPPEGHLEPIFAAASPVDGAWYNAHAALTYAHTIRIPYYQQNNWQDEQTGPRAVVLWHHIHPDPVTILDKDGQPKVVVPKKFVLSSGDHGHGGFAGRDRWAFFDIFLQGMRDRTGLFDAAVVNHFEARGDGSSTATTSGAAWPFPGTTWQKVWLREGGALAWEPPTGAEQAQSYASGVARHGWFYHASDLAQHHNAMGLPDAVAYESPALERTMAIAGPLRMDLTASLTGVDTDFFVSIADVWPDGSISWVQRGLLKASHRAIDPLRSYHDASGYMYQPYRPHTNPQPVEPLAQERYVVEVFPVGHLFREGHRILVQLHTPPAVDGLWGYTATHHAPGVVTVHTGLGEESSLTLPLVALDGPMGPAPPGCQVPEGFPCIQPLRVPLP
jgi:uncharacterized protein